ncbi:hypothetical protein [Microbispora siamensis]|uniref:Uncharacterized protein n=1 Tax=Microbispora siamensis TaxID=564413 RepID=A0ABQ4GD79_9ACTN|nr:hypothetical protein [Microbispora siamensis]GIH59378.1 hypothetical protein Msi02_01950 [Microbispora siamensis]
MLVPALAGLPKLVAAAVMAMSATTFAITGVYELTASQGWRTTAGVAGLVLAVVAYYAALAFSPGFTVAAVVSMPACRTTTGLDSPNSPAPRGGSTAR